MTCMAGVHEQYQGTVDDTTPEETLERYPLTTVTREFNANPIGAQNIVPKLKTLCQEVWDAGLVAAVSFKFKPEDVLNGAWKPYIQSAVAWLRDNDYADKTLFIIWHEPENDVPKWFKDAQTFVTHFNTVHDWVKQIDPKLLTIHAALGYRYADKGASTGGGTVPIDIDDATAKVWGKCRADIKAIDIYCGRSFPLGQILPEMTGFKRWVTFTVGATAMWGVTERGWMADSSSEYALRASTIKREGDWLRGTPEGRRCILYIVWLTVGTENDPTLKPDPSMVDAVNYLLEKVNEPDPTPEPDPEPEQPPVGTTTCPLCHGEGTVPTGTYTIVKVS